MIANTAKIVYRAMVVVVVVLDLKEKVQGEIKLNIKQTILIGRQVDGKYKSMTNSFKVRDNFKLIVFIKLTFIL